MPPGPSGSSPRPKPPSSKKKKPLPAPVEDLKREAIAVRIVVVGCVAKDEEHVTSRLLDTIDHGCSDVDVLQAEKAIAPGQSGEKTRDNMMGF